MSKGVSVRSSCVCVFMSLSLNSSIALKLQFPTDNLSFHNHA